MTARIRLLICVAPLLLLAGCASSGSQAAANPPPSPTSVMASAAQFTPDRGSTTEGEGSDVDRAKVDASNNQIYQAEHASDPDAASVSNAQNQGIP